MTAPHRHATPAPAREDWRRQSWVAQALLPVVHLGLFTLVALPVHVFGTLVQMIVFAQVHDGSLDVGAPLWVAISTVVMSVISLPLLYGLFLVLRWRQCRGATVIALVLNWTAIAIWTWCQLH